MISIFLSEKFGCQNFVPSIKIINMIVHSIKSIVVFVVVVFVLLFYVHGKHLRSCRDGQLT